MPPKVAIITRTKDRLLLLERAVQSVAAQTMRDWHQVIVNDGGNADELDAFVASLSEDHQKRLTVLHHPSSLGMQAASNAGVKASKSEFVCIHDDDDQWHPEYLESVIHFLDKETEKSPYQGVVCGTEEVLEKLAGEGKLQEISRKPHIPLEEISLFRMGYENPFPPIAFCYRRSAYEALSGYDPRWDVVADMDFNLRFLLRYEIGVIPDVLAYYHIRDEADTGSYANSIRDRKALHKRLFNEFKNTHLRSTDSPKGASLALGLNVSGYLIEAQWILHDVFHRIQQTEKAIDTLGKSIALDGYEDRFDTVRQALAVLIDHVRDTGIRDTVAGTRQDLSRLGEAQQDHLDRLQQDLDKTIARIGTGLHNDMGEAASARGAMSSRFEELIRSTGLPGDSDQFETVRQALNILIEHSTDPSVRETLQAVHNDMGEAARARGAMSSRFEELIRSTGLPGDSDQFETVRQALNILIEHATDPRVLETLQAVHNDMGEAARARGAMSSRFEELIRSTGLPGDSDQFETVRQALNILIEHATDPRVRETLETINGRLDEAARVRGATAARLEELIRSIGLNGDPESANNLQEKTTWLVDFIKDPTRNGEDFRMELNQIFEGLEARLRRLEEQSLEVRVGRLKIATIKPSRKPEI